MQKEELIRIFKKLLEERNVDNSIRGIASSKIYKQTAMNLTTFLDSVTRKKKGGTPVSERLYCLVNDIKSEDEMPKCVICGDTASFLNYSVGYSQTCCMSCRSKLTVSKELEQNSGKFRFQTKEFKEKSKETLIEKYGVDNAMHITEVQEKQKQTMLDKYGVENCSQAEEIKQKKIDTCRERYGADYHWQTDEGRMRQKQGVIDKYGVDNVSQLDWVKDKKIDTSINNWGVENPSQSIIIRKRILENNGEEYILPSGAKKLIDGRIEKITFDYLFSIYPEDKIIIQPELNISYFDKLCKSHVWFPDALLYLSDRICLVEVKHAQTLSLETNLKYQAEYTLKNGYSFLLFLLHEYKSGKQSQLYKLEFKSNIDNYNFDLAFGEHDKNQENIVKGVLNKHMDLKFNI